MKPLTLPDSGRLVLVADENGIPLVVPEREARIGMLRYAETLRPGSYEQGYWTDKALNGELPECPAEVAAQFAPVAAEVA